MIIICIKKEDVSTRKIGKNYEILLPNGLAINFTTDALDEFIKDVEFIKEKELETNKE